MICPKFEILPALSIGIIAQSQSAILYRIAVT